MCKRAANPLTSWRLFVIVRTANNSSRAAPVYADRAVETGTRAPADALYREVQGRSLLEPFAHLRALFYAREM